MVPLILHAYITRNTRCGNQESYNVSESLLQLHHWDLTFSMMLGTTMPILYYTVLSDSTLYKTPYCLCPKLRSLLFSGELVQTAISQETIFPGNLPCLLSTSGPSPHSLTGLPRLTGCLEYHCCCHVFLVPNKGITLLESTVA